MHHASGNPFSSRSFFCRSEEPMRRADHHSQHCGKSDRFDGDDRRPIGFRVRDRI